ncbi:unnamed protein product, partial [Brassica oleracea]
VQIWCHQDFVPSVWFHRFGSKTRCIRKTRERGRTRTLLLMSSKKCYC